jgi:branched-chain amino acid transport system ATP-binding protein
MLNIKSLHVAYGAIRALKGLNFELAAGEIVALIGANGAGKSTTLNAISGICQPASGEMFFEGQEITHTCPEAIVRRGVIQVPEGRNIFARMTVRKNLEMGAYTLKDKNKLERNMARVFEIFPRLEERQHQLGGTLSGGEQQMLAMGRGLMGEPRLMLLDEPSMGLAPLLVEQIFEVIQSINNSGVSVLLVEQNAQMALAIADRAYVLETGKVVLSGPSEKLIKNPMVKEAYLGG